MKYTRSSLDMIQNTAKQCKYSIQHSVIDSVDLNLWLELFIINSHLDFSFKIKLTVKYLIVTLHLLFKYDTMPVWLTNVHVDASHTAVF